MYPIENKTNLKLNPVVTNSGPSPNRFVPEFNLPVPESKRVAQYSDEELQKLIEKGQTFISENSDTTQIDVKLFAHIHADSFGKDTSLEGNNFFNTIPHLLGLIQKHNWLDCLGGNLTARLKECALYESSIAGDQKAINDLASTIAYDISKLEPGKSLLIPGGYTDKSSGHAMLYQFCRDSSGQLNVEVFNTGDGLRHHDPKGVKAKEKYASMVRYTGIASDLATLQDFIQCAIECKIPLPNALAVDPPYNADYIYEKLLPMLGGTKEFSEDPPDVMNAQIGGFCSEKVLHAYIRHMVLKTTGNVEAYKDFKYQFKRQALINFFQQCKNRALLGSDDGYILLRKASEKFARSIYKRKKEGEDLETDTAILKAIRYELKQARKVEPDSSFLSFGTVESNYSYVDFSIHDINAQLASRRPIQNVEKRPELTDKIDNIETLKTSAAYLSKLKSSIKKGQSSLDHANEALHFAHEVIQRIDYKSPSLSDISPDESAEIVDYLNQIGDVFYKAQKNLSNYHNKPILPSTVALQRRLYALTAFFAKKDPRNKLDNAIYAMNKTTLSNFWISFLPNIEADLEKQESDSEESSKFIKNLVLRPSYQLTPDYATYSGYDGGMQDTSKYARYIEQFIPKTGNRKLFLKQIAEEMVNLGKGKKCFLPNSIYALKNQYLRLESLISYGYYKKTFNFPIESSKLNLNTNGITRFLELLPGDHPITYEIKSNLSKDAASNENELFPNLNKFLSCSWGTIVNYKYTKEGEIDIDEANDFRSLSSSTYSHPYATLSLFEKYLSRLGNRSYQEFFTINLFGNAKLEKYLQDNPEFMEKASKFLTHGIRHFQAVGNSEACCFFIQTISRLRAFGQSEVLPNETDIVSEWFSSAKDVKEKALYAHYLLAAYNKRNSVNQTELKLLLEANVYQKTFPLNFADFFLPHEIEGCFSKHLRQNINSLDSQDVSMVCNGLLSHLLDVKSSGLTWQVDFPVAKAKAMLGNQVQYYEVNLFSGDVNVNGLGLYGVPTSLRHTKTFQEFFGDKAVQVKLESEKSYLIKEHPEDSDYKFRLIQIDDHNVIVQYRLEGVWVELKPDVKTEVFGCEFLHKGDRYVWVETQTNGKAPRIFITDRDKKILHIGETEGESLLRRMITFRNKPSHAIKRIYTPKIDLEPERELIDIGHSKTHPYAFLETFENKNWIAVWKDVEEVPQNTFKSGLIELPRYGLKFNVKSLADGTQRAWSNNVKDYYLAPQGRWKGLGNQKNYLVLEGRDRNLKVCFSRLKIEGYENSSSHLKLDYVLSDNCEDRRCFMIDVDKDGELSPKSTEEKLYVFYLYMAKSRDPAYAKKALKILTEIRHIRPFNENENEIIKWVLNNKSAIKNWDPDSVAIRLKLCAVWAENQEKFSMNEQMNEEDADYIDGLFLHYLKVIQNVSSKLTNAEEKLILKKLRQAMFLSNELVRLLHLRQGEDTGGENHHYHRSYYKCSLHASSEDLNVALNKRDRNLSKNTALSCSKTYLKNLENCFQSYYEIAIGNHEDERKSLLRRLQAGRLPLAENVNRILQDILVMALRHPHKFRNLGSSPKGFSENYIKELFETYQTLLSEVNDEKEAYCSINRPRLKGECKPHKVVPQLSWGMQPLKLMERPIAIDKARDHFDFTPSDETNDKSSGFQFPCGFKDPVLNTYLAGYNQDINDYFENAPEIGPKVVLKDSKQLIKDLKEIYKKEKTGLKLEEKRLLALANKKPLDKIKSIRVSLKILGRKQQKINLKNLVGLYLRGDEEQFKRRNPQLDDQDIHVLMQATSNYLERSLTQQKRKRSLTLAKDISALDSSDPAFTQLNTKLVEELTSERKYGESTKPERIRAFQVFEYLSDMQIRTKQVTMIENILDGKIGEKEREFISQLIMGGGKSKVILPILALLLAQGDNLVLLMVPKELLETQKEFMSELSGGLFDQNANTIDFNRETPFTVQRLEKIHATLLKAMHNREYLVMSPETVQALELRYVECRKLIKKGEKDYQDEMLVLGNILRLLRTKSVCIIDEADTILDPRRELNFTMKDGVSINEAHLKLIREIYGHLVQDEEISPLVQLCKGEQVSRSKANGEKIKQLLIDKFIKRFCSSSIEEDEFRAYLSSNDKTKAVPDFILKKEESEKDLITVLKEELNTYLPLTLSNNAYQNYTFSDTKQLDFAIPALKSQPQEGSQFGNHYEAINYTLQMALQTGIRDFQIASLVSRLIRSAQLEMKHRVALENTAAYRFFTSIYPDKGLFTITPKDYSDMANYINQDKDSVLDFLEACVLNQILIYPEKITSDPLRLASMFSKVYGFTGTPWNSLCYHNRFGTVDLDKGTDGYTTSLLLQKAEPVLEDLSKVNGGFHAFIDSGAIYKGIPGEEIARQFLDKVDTKGVVFYKNNQLHILEKGQKNPIPFSQTNLKPEDRFTHYDDAHTIGADIDQKFDARALVSIGENIYLKDLLQAVWRLRGLGLQQSVVFYVPEECRKLINRTLKRDEEAKIEVKDILLFSAINQARRQGEDLSRATKQKITNEIRDVILSLVLDLEVTHPEEAQELFNLFDLDGLFSVTQENKPFEQFGEPERKGKTKKILENYKSNWELKVASCIEERKKEGNVSDHLEQLMNGINEKVKSKLKAVTIPEIGQIPKEESVKSRESKGTEIQVQLHVQQKTEVNLQLEVEDNITHFDDNAFDWRIWNDHKEIDSFQQDDAIVQDKSKYPLGLIMTEKDRRLKRFADLFTENKEVHVFSSHNFHPYTRTTYQFFDRRQKRINSVLLNEMNGELHVCLLSDWDSDGVIQELQERRLNFEGAKTKHGAWIYDMRSDEHHQVISDEAAHWAKDPRWLRLEVKLRIFNAETDYTEEQELILRDIIQKIGGPRSFLTLFSTIVEYRDSKNTFVGSALHQLLLEMISGQDEAANQKAFKDLLNRFASFDKKVRPIRPDDKKLELKPIFEGLGNEAAATSDREIDLLVGKQPEEPAKPKSMFQDILIKLNEELLAIYLGPPRKFTFRQ